MQGKKANKALTDVLYSLQLEKEKVEKRSNLAIDEAKLEFQKKLNIAEDSKTKEIQ